MDATATARTPTGRLVEAGNSPPWEMADRRAAPPDSVKNALRVTGAGVIVATLVFLAPCPATGRAVQNADRIDADLPSNAEEQDAVSGKEFSVAVSFNGRLCWEFAANGTVVIDGETVGTYDESAGRIFGFWRGHTDRFANPGTGGEAWFGVHAFGVLVFGIGLPAVPILNPEHLSWSMSGSLGCAEPLSR